MRVTFVGWNEGGVAKPRAEADACRRHRQWGNTEGSGTRSKGRCGCRSRDGLKDFFELVGDEEDLRRLFLGEAVRAAPAQEAALPSQ